MQTPIYVDGTNSKAPWLERLPTGILNQRSFIDGAIFIIYAYEIERVFHQQHVEHLQRDPTSKVLIIHDHSPLNSAKMFIEQIVLPFIETYKLDQSQLVLLLMHSADLNRVKIDLSERNMNIQVEYRNQLLHDITPLYPLVPVQEVKKFSILSRAFKDARLEFFFDLFDKDLINECLYSFNNINPYTHPHTVISTDIIFNMLSEWATNNNISSQRLTDIGLPEWINGLPYSVGNDISTLSSKSLFDLIRQTYIHVIFETSVSTDFQSYGITEKTYKAIAAKKPFILYGDAFALKALRELDGFKTFHPYINEEYDNVLDLKLRKNMIIAEMKRINNLPQHEFLELIENCRSIVDHNFDNLIKLKSIPWSPEFRALGIL